MTKTEHIKQTDRLSNVQKKAKLLLSDTVNISGAQSMATELMQDKLYFSEFFGKESPELALADSLLRIVRALQRSIVFNQEEPEQTLSQWQQQSPNRTLWVSALENQLAEFA
ncbi:MAG: hypothetical protein GJ680_18180 [Alteromonadaceae bacterium]|nr:hypothetical protein [Alteromonadaceae bacterium]